MADIPQCQSTQLVILPMGGPIDGFKGARVILACASALCGFLNINAEENGWQQKRERGFEHLLCGGDSP